MPPAPAGRPTGAPAPGHARPPPRVRLVSTCQDRSLAVADLEFALQGPEGSADAGGGACWSPSGGVVAWQLLGLGGYPHALALAGAAAAPAAEPPVPLARSPAPPQRPVPGPVRAV